MRCEPDPLAAYIELARAVVLNKRRILMSSDTAARERAAAAWRDWREKTFARAGNPPSPQPPPPRPTMAPTDKPRNSLALLSRVLNSAGREEEDEAAALIERRQRNHARFLQLAARGHASERNREAMLTEAEREHLMDDLEQAMGDNGGPPLADAPSPESEQARADLAAAKSSGNASDGGE